MKISYQPHRRILALLLGLAGLAASHASAQTVITSVPIIINTSGHYTLNGNLNSSSTTFPAIRVSAPNVTIDLNGYYVAGPGDPSAGYSVGTSVIYVDAVANVTIRNGTVAGNAIGIQFGVNTPNAGRNYLVENVTLTRCYLAGVYFYSQSAPGSVIKGCSFSTIGNSTVNAPAISPSAIVSAGDLRIEGNSIGDVTPTGSGKGYGIKSDTGDFAIGNTIANCYYGISGASKNLNNLTYNVTVPFSGGINVTGNN